MSNDTARKPTNAVDPKRVAPKNEKRERRWLQDALEDDEVYEALALRRAQEKAKSDD